VKITPRVDLENDIRGTRVGTRVVELIAQRLTREYLLNAERLLIGRRAQVCNHCGRQRRIGEPDQGSIVRNVEGVGRADGRRGLSAADSAAFCCRRPVTDRASR